MLMYPSVSGNPCHRVRVVPFFWNSSTRTHTRVWVNPHTRAGYPYPRYALFWVRNAFSPLSQILMGNSGRVKAALSLPYTMRWIDPSWMARSRSMVLISIQFPCPCSEDH
jgi:hypothetical protein